MTHKGVVIFDARYGEVEDEKPFKSLEEAISYAMYNLPSDDFPYMIGYSDERGILAFVFQGSAYLKRAQ